MCLPLPSPNGISIGSAVFAQFIMGRIYVVRAVDAVQ